MDPYGDAIHEEENGPPPEVQALGIAQHIFHHPDRYDATLNEWAQSIFSDRLPPL